MHFEVDFAQKESMEQILFLPIISELLGRKALFVTKIMYLCGRKNFLMTTMKKIILLIILTVIAMTADAQFLFS